MEIWGNGWGYRSRSATVSHTFMPDPTRPSFTKFATPDGSFWLHRSQNKLRDSIPTDNLKSMARNMTALRGNGTNARGPITLTREGNRAPAGIRPSVDFQGKYLEFGPSAEQVDIESKKFTFFPEFRIPMDHCGS